VNDRWVLLEVIDKIAPGSVNWKVANPPPIKLPFRKVENCNQVLKIGKELKFSLVNIAGNDIVQGNKKLILGKWWFNELCVCCIFSHVMFFTELYTLLIIKSVHKLE
jgi:hypothetical protein